jgi:glycosyltransferase involved in cell wall biosynthesis
MGDYAITSSWEETNDVKKSRKDGKIETVLDGANLFERELRMKKEDLKREWEIPEEKFVVGYTGGLVPTKGINFLFPAIKTVLEKREDIFFLIGGFPPDYVEKFIKENSFEKNVRLVSPLDYFKLGEFLRVLDVGVDPKGTDTGEASGKMLNYMGAGLPVVCFDKMNNRNYLKDGGYFSLSGSAKSLTEKIMEAVDKRDESLEKGTFNRKEASRYSWASTAMKINRIYESLK